MDSLTDTHYQSVYSLICILVFR